MTTLDLKSYTKPELEDLFSQVQQEIRNREYNKWMSPAYAPLQQFHQQWSGFSRMGRYSYPDFMGKVEDWARHLGVKDTAEDWVSQMVFNLEHGKWNFDDFVDPSE